jgi:hypothetical protein
VLSRSERRLLAEVVDHQHAVVGQFDELVDKGRDEPRPGIADQGKSEPGWIVEWRIAQLRIVPPIDEPLRQSEVRLLARGFGVHADRVHAEPAVGRFGPPHLDAAASRLLDGGIQYLALRHDKIVAGGP